MITPCIMFGSSRILGATRIPETAPTAAARPHPRPSISPARTPSSSLTCGYRAAARIASPSLVRLKSTYSSPSISKLVPMMPAS